MKDKTSIICRNYPQEGYIIISDTAFIEEVLNKYEWILIKEYSDNESQVFKNNLNNELLVKEYGIYGLFKSIDVIEKLHVQPEVIISIVSSNKENLISEEMKILSLKTLEEVLAEIRLIYPVKNNIYCNMESLKVLDKQIIKESYFSLLSENKLLHIHFISYLYNNETRSNTFITTDNKGNIFLCYDNEKYFDIGSPYDDIILKSKEGEFAFPILEFLYDMCLSRKNIMIKAK